MAKLTSKVLRNINCKDAMEQALKSFGFTAFESVEDLGFYSWTPRGNYKKLHQVSAAELRQNVSFSAKPPEVQPIAKLQFQCPCVLKSGIGTLNKENIHNEYPYNPSHLVPLYVAMAGRNIRPGDIDFLLGGSVLHALATGETSGDDFEYRVQQVPGTKIVLVEKYKLYTTNWNDAGHLFEYFVHGRDDMYNLLRIHNEYVIYEHLQKMIVHGHTILISAESDGMDQDGNAVEIKTSNPKNWKAKVAFQMISNGSLQLYWGETISTASIKKKRDGGVNLRSVQAFSFKEVLRMSIRNDSQPDGLRQLEERLCASLDTLAKACSNGDLSDGRVYTLHFNGLSLEVLPISLLPMDSVVHDILSVRQEITRQNHQRKLERQDPKGT